MAAFDFSVSFFLLYYGSSLDHTNYAEYLGAWVTQEVHFSSWDRDKGSEEEGKNLSRIALRKYSDFGENCFVLILDLPSSKNPNSYWPLPSQFWGMVGPFSARLWIY